MTFLGAPGRDSGRSEDGVLIDTNLLVVLVVGKAGVLPGGRILIGSV